MPLPITTTLGEKTLAEMLARAQETNVRARQADVERRVLMLQENWRHYVYAYVNNTYKVPDVKTAICRRVKRTYNVLQQLCNRVCVAYTVPPVRELKGAPQSAQDAFVATMKESKIVTKAKAWERFTFATNVLITVPRVRRDSNGQGPRLDYEMILADRAEVYTDTADPMGDPIAVAYQCKHGSDFSPDPMQTVVLDRQAWWYLDSKGRPIGHVDHGAGIFPGTVWRLDEPIDDWWNSHRGEGIADATIEVAHLAARMDWVRHSQDRYREYLAATAADLTRIPQQVAGGEGPTHIPISPNGFAFEAVDVNTPIDRHRDHIQLYLRQAAESIGVPSIIVDFDMLQGTDDMQVQQHAALAKLRNGQCEYYRVSEADSAWKTALVLRGMGHPAARELRPEIVKEHFTIQYPELTFVDHPIKRAEVSEKLVALGLSSTVREYQRLHPELTFAEANEQVLEIAKEEGELNELYIRNNWPRGAAGKMTLAQAQGAAGGRASGEARSENDDDAGGPGRAGSGSGNGNGDQRSGYG